MGEFSIAHNLVIAVVVIVLFGRGKFNSIMGEFGRGITAFKQGTPDSVEETPAPARLPDLAEPTRQA